MMSSALLSDHCSVSGPNLIFCGPGFALTLRVLGGGGLFGPCDAKFSEKCPCSHDNYTALIKQISLLNTALVIRNT